MFGIGGTELLVILVVALLVLGPKSLPDIAKTLGKAMGEFRRVSTEFQRTLNTEVELDAHEQRKKEAAKDLFDTPSSDTPSSQPAASAPSQPAASATATPQPATASQPAPVFTEATPSAASPTAGPAIAGTVIAGPVTAASATHAAAGAEAGVSGVAQNAANSAGTVHGDDHGGRA